MESHVRIVGILHTIFAGFHILLALIGLAFFAAIVEFMPEFEFFAAIVSIVIAFFIIVSLPQLLAGIGLLGCKGWGRILGIIIGALQLLNFPIGTALGIYTLWALTPTEANSVFAPAD